MTEHDLHLIEIGEKAGYSKALHRISKLRDALEEVIIELEQGYITSALESAKQAVRETK